MKEETQKIAERMRDAATRHHLYAQGGADVTPESNPQHHTVGREYMGGIGGKRWFCESHDANGYWMYATDGSNEWTNVSERAINRTFHEIYVDWTDTTNPRLHCPGYTIKPYVAGHDIHESYRKLYVVPEEVARV